MRSLGNGVPTRPHVIEHTTGIPTGIGDGLFRMGANRYAPRPPGDARLSDKNLSTSRRDADPKPRRQRVEDDPVAPVHRERFDHRLAQFWHNPLTCPDVTGDSFFMDFAPCKRILD